MMPCLCGTLPVAIVVQMMGDHVGVSVWSFPNEPSSIKRSRTGSCPSPIISRMIRHSRPSTPMRRTGDSTPEISSVEQAVLAKTRIANTRESAPLRANVSKLDAIRYAVFDPRIA